jgi:two-component system sensor kinase FixL
VRLSQPDLDHPGRQAFIRAGLVIAVIAWVDAFVVPAFSLGLLYFLPLLFAAAFLRPNEVAALSLISAVLAEQFSPSPWDSGVFTRFVISSMGYLGSAFFIREVERKHKSALIHAAVSADQIRRRESAERKLRSFVDGSPAAIVTLDRVGSIDLANEAAHEMLGCESGALGGLAIKGFLPAIDRLRQSAGRAVRTSIECTGYRRDGEVFSAQVWVSAFGDPEEGGLGLVVFDASEQLRSREEGRLQSLTASARIILGSFWHETRNFCTALRLTTAALRRNPAVADAEELVAILSLVDGLEKLCSAELRPADRSTEEDCASVRVVLDHLRVVVEPAFREHGAAIEWRIADELPLVRAERHALLQVFLNIARNAAKAMEGAQGGVLLVDAAPRNEKVLVLFRNNGPEVPRPELLFSPFQPEAEGAGIGLFVSRAMVRSFGGDLRHERYDGFTCFAVILEKATWFLNSGAGGAG